jgi:hypothetical protein
MDRFFQEVWFLPVIIIHPSSILTCLEDLIKKNPFEAAVPKYSVAPYS